MSGSAAPPAGRFPPREGGEKTRLLPHGFQSGYEMEWLVAVDASPGKFMTQLKISFRCHRLLFMKNPFHWATAAYFFFAKINFDKNAGPWSLILSGNNSLSAFNAWREGTPQPRGRKRPLHLRRNPFICSYYVRAGLSPDFGSVGQPRGEGGGESIVQLMF